MKIDKKAIDDLKAAWAEAKKTPVVKGPFGQPGKAAALPSAPSAEVLNHPTYLRNKAKGEELMARLQVLKGKVHAFLADKKVKK